MRRLIGFLIVLLCGLALVSTGTAMVAHRTARAWFEKDVGLRARLAVGGARQALVANWSVAQGSGLLGLLTEITHDERVMAAAACGSAADSIVQTADFPKDFDCRSVGAQLGLGPDRTTPYTEVVSLPEGDVHLSAIPVLDGGKPLGFVMLVHDLSFIARREAVARTFFLVTFGVLALAASSLTIVAARVWFKDWSRQLIHFLRGGNESPEFRPLLRDVRDLIDRLVTERDTEHEAGPWTPGRLKPTLNRYLHGERIVIVANREPYIHERTKDGGVDILHPASGLVTALEPVMRACSGVWVAHGGGSADRESSDKRGHVRVPPGEESYVIRRVWLSADEEQGYYYGFANEGLWPLCHIAHARPIFRRSDFEHYAAVNRRFTDAICDEVDTDDPVILVQDYHFSLVPRLVRERLPRATVIMFWHIPWPNPERFGICPWGKELLDGMLGARILGFHTQFHCNNFLDSVDRFLEARIDREQNAVVQRGHSTLVRPYPISVEWPVRWLDSAEAPDDCRRQVLSDLGLRSDTLLGIGVDRLDYTKGVEERLLAVERLLERFPSYRGRFTFVQLAAPSRTAIERYRELNQSVEALAERINERFGKGMQRPIVLLRAHHEPPTVFRFYRAAHVCYVSSLHDGMNLVAKEFIAARDDEQGVLILSRFTGAARELPEALLVNPYDLDAASSALDAALRMSPAEQRERLRSLRALVADFNVYRWAGRMLVDAARLRQRERISDRLMDHLERRVAVSS